ncbi:MAG: LolA family protein [Bdellovibrionota bacterium]|jgi:outer membrane lipoprotein carrier protein
MQRNNIIIKFLVFGSILGTFLVTEIASAQQQMRSFECTEQVSNKEAQELIDRVQKKYSNITALHANFIQSSYLAAVDTSEGSSGQVWLAKPAKMKWQYEVPEEQSFLMNDKTLWYYQPLDQQVLIQNFEEVVLTDLPVAFLVGVGDLRKDFTLQASCRSSNGVVLKLKQVAGHEAKEELAGFSLLIDTALDFPRGAEISHVGGNRTSILLENIELQPKISDDIFKPDFPKGTDINDMRKK